MDTSKDSENQNGFPHYRRSHLRSHTYDTLVHIVSHHSTSSPQLLSPTRHLQIPDNGSGRMEQDKQQQELECSEFVGSDFMDLKDPVPQKEIQKVNETMEQVEDKGMEFNANKVLNDIDLMMGIEKDEDSLGRQVEAMSMPVNALNMEQKLMDKFELVEKETDDLFCDNILIPPSSEDYLMDYKVEHIEFQHVDVNNATDSSNNLTEKGDIGEREIFGDIGMDDNSFLLSSADSLLLQIKNIDEVDEEMQLSFDLDVNIFEDDELFDYAILKDELEMWNEEEKLKRLICAHNATNSSDNPIEEGEIEEGEIIGDFGMGGNSFDMSSEVKQKVDVSSKKKRGPGSEKQKARKELKKRKKRAEKIRNERKHTVCCYHYLNGRCLEGNKCNFSHDPESLTKSKPCYNFARGSCMRGDKCLFDHQLSKYSCTNFVSRGSCCRGDGCMFSHKVQTKKDIPTFSNVSRLELKSSFLPGKTSMQNIR